MREYATTNSDRLLSRGGLLSRHSGVSRSSIRHRRNIRVTLSSIRLQRHSIKVSLNSVSHHHSIRVSLQCTRVILILWLSHIRISSTDSLHIRLSRSIDRLLLRHSTGRLHHHRSTAISRLKRDRLSSTGKRKDPTRHQNSCSG